MKIGFIGLGIMGESMAENIVKKHNDTVFVSDHKQSQIDKLAAMGAVGCKTNPEVARQADLIITMVPKSEHVKGVYTEILDCIDSSKICIDMSTIDPSVSVEVADMIKSRGAQFADCPVVKSKAAAIDGTLGIFVGCDEALMPVIEPILKYMGTNILRLGGNGSGITMKICSNMLVAAVQNGVNETLLLAESMGIPIDDFATAISYGGAKNVYLENQKEKLKNSDWTTAFSLENEHKDVTIACKLAEQQGLDLPGLKACKAVFDEGMDMGLGKSDFRRTFEVVKKRGGKK